MSDGRWSEERDEFIERMSRMFLGAPAQYYSSSSKASVKRHRNPITVTKLVLAQAKEYENNNLPYSTPEEWDSSFTALGGGLTRRTSKFILKVMTWYEFLENLKIFLNN